MIVLWECVAACILFGLGTTIATFRNRTYWLREYPKNVQKKYLETHPDLQEKKKKEGNKGTVIAKLIFLVAMLLLLVGLGYWAGARSFIAGFLDTYIIWFVVNLFDLFVLDLGLFMYWKKIRLPGTEDMNEEYTSNKMHHVKEGIKGMIMGIPVCLIAGILIMILC